jgi:hypothetical protein
MEKDSDISGLAVCSIAGCGKKVSKLGHTLCYQHWKAHGAEVPEASNSATQPPQKSASNSKASAHLTSTQLGEKLGISSQRINQVLAELGWIEKAKKGWIPTNQGKKLQAESREHHATGIPFVLWPESILLSRILTNSVKELVGQKESSPALLSEKPHEDAVEKLPGFREKFEPTHRTMDGHWVRSKAETLIDNWLYMSGVVHAYERLLPVEEELYCDFYIPEGKVYIEFWGMESNPKYQARKKVKLDIYRKYNFNLIELNDEHVKNLDDHLPKMLLKYNVIVS